jgi:hypothetical protein
MRVAAPFYFAKNQAWRRAFRVMHEDPGAFERYLKINLSVTNFMAVQTAGGGSPSTTMPGSQFMGWLGTVGANIPGFMSSAPSVFQQMGFGLAVQPGSIESVFPTGAEMGIAGALGLVRPPWGPLITLPIKEMAKLFNVSQHPLLQKFEEAILGPIASRSSMYSDLLPSTGARNILDITLSAFHYDSPAMISSENLVLNNAVDNLYKQQLKKVFDKYDWSGMSLAQKNNMARGMAELEVSKILGDHRTYQQFLDHAHAAAMLMTFTKSLISFFSPVSVNVQAQFSQNKEFQALQQKINPDTNKKYTFTEAAAKFGELHPESVMDLVAKSDTINGHWAETVSAAELLRNHPDIARNYSYAGAMLVDRNTAYSPEAYQLEMSLKLRQRSAPQQYLDNLLIATGNDYYYNYLSIDPTYGGDANNPNPQRTAEQYAALKDAALNYGRTSNPTWLANWQGGKSQNTSINTIEEMRTMIKDPKVPTSVLGKSDRNKFQELLDSYDSVVAEVQALRAQGSKGDAYTVASQWFDWCTNQAATSDYYKKQAYFITSALRSLPSK